MSHICTGVNPSSGAASASGCPHVEHSAGSIDSTWSTLSETSRPEPGCPLCPPGLRVLDRSRCDAAFRRLALAAGGSELGGREEFELSIDSRRRNSAFSAVSRSISSPCESPSWSWTCARSACSRTVSS